MDPWTWTIFQLMSFPHELDDTAEAQLDLFLKQVNAINLHEANGNV